MFCAGQVEAKLLVEWSIIVILIEACIGQARYIRSWQLPRPCFIPPRKHVRIERRDASRRPREQEAMGDGLGAS